MLHLKPNIINSEEREGQAAQLPLGLVLLPE